jgi:hypothetical protein
VTVLENPPPVTAVIVDCAAGDTIFGALAQGAGGALTITVIGQCTETDVTVARDDVTVQGGSSLDIDGNPVDELLGNFIVDDSHRVVIQNLLVTGPQSNTSVGVYVRDSASVVLDNLRLSSHGSNSIAVQYNSFAQISETTVIHDANIEGVIASDQSTIHVVGGSYLDRDIYGLTVTTLSSAVRGRDRRFQRTNGPLCASREATMLSMERYA